jgi:hypothetical protein
LRRLLAQILYDSDNSAYIRLILLCGDVRDLHGIERHNRKVAVTGGLLCLLDEHNLILALDLGQRGFDLAPHLLPVFVLVVTAMQTMPRIVAVAVCVVKHDIAIALQDMLAAQHNL